MIPLKNLYRFKLSKCAQTYFVWALDYASAEKVIQATTSADPKNFSGEAEIVSITFVANGYMFVNAAESLP